MMALTSLLSRAVIARRHVRRPDQREPERRLKARHAGLDHRRNLRHLAGAPVGAHREDLDLAVLDQRQARAERSEGDVDAAFGKVDDRLRGRTVRNVIELDAGHVREHLGREMRDAAEPYRRIIQNAGLRFRQREQLTHVLHRQLRRHRQRIGHDADHRDRREILDRIVDQLGVDDGVGDVRGGRRHAERVAVGRGLGDRIGADGAAGAGAVLDHDGLPEPFAELGGDQPSDHVDRRPRRQRDNHADLPAGPCILGAGVGDDGKHRQQRDGNAPHSR